MYDFTVEFDPYKISYIRDDKMLIERLSSKKPFKL